MQSATHLKRHEALVTAMATRRGLDLDEAMMRGVMTPSELDDAVLRCTGCAQPDACAHWLEQSATADTEDSGPRYCRNTDLFQTLTRGLGQ